MTDIPHPRAFVVGFDGQRARLYTPIHPPSYSIGSGSENDLCLPEDSSVSSRHCIIRTNEKGMILEDCASRNGTYLKGRRIQGEATIRLPCHVTLGRTNLLFLKSPPAQELTELLEPVFSSKGTIVVPPSCFFEAREEAFLVVDVVGSTRIVKEKETSLAKIVSALGQMLTRSLFNESEPYLECTGDGFLACFGSVEACLDSALKLGLGLRRHINIPVQLSIALHWGTSRVSDYGNRTGKNVHAVFSLERLRHQEKLLADQLTSEEIPQLVLMTRRFRNELSDSTEVRLKSLGFYELAGLDEDMEVFQMQDSSGSRESVDSL